MNRSALSLKTTIPLNIAFFILPFLMFHWMIPFLSHWTLGNDYVDYPIDHQMELMFALKTGTFPLYIPGFAGGQSASALTLGQVYHPISHIASWLPGYWEGKALEWMTLLRLLTIGAAHFFLFRFLRGLKIDIFKASILSLITVYNLRMLDLFRYGAALESWTGFLFLCAAIGWYFLKPTKWKGPLGIIAATYWLVCSGHPQMMYYGLLGAGIFALIIPYFIGLMIPERQVDAGVAGRFWLRVLIFCGLGILLSSAYILPFFFDFIRHNAERLARDYVWADRYRDTLMGTVNNFFFPLRSDVTGVFGGTTLILVAALVPLLPVFRVRVPAVVWVIYGLLVFIFLHMQGARTPIHYLTWKYLPLASSFRVAGRISMLAPVLLMLILAWVMRSESFRIQFSNKEIRILPLAGLASAAFILVVVYLALPESLVGDVSQFSATAIRQVPAWMSSTFLIVGLAFLAVLIVFCYIDRSRAAVEFLLGLLICIQIILCLQFGTWVEPEKNTASLAQMRAEKRKNLNYHRSIGYGLASSAIIRQVKWSFLEPVLAKTYRTYRNVASNEAAYALMADHRSPQEVILENYAPDRHQPPAVQINKKAPDRVKLIYNSYNRLVFATRTGHAGFLGLAYPYSGNWKAFVNNTEVPVYRANGAYHAVHIPAGVTRVEFRYWSAAAFWGMVISCATLFIIGTFLSLQIQTKPLKVFVIFMSGVIAVGGYSLWYRSLYRGDNLGTVHIWQEAPMPSIPNIAYGKRTNMSSLFFSHYLYNRSSGLAVDGVRTPGSGFVTGLEDNPWWVVDLHRLRSVNAIVIYEGRNDAQYNTRPLIVLFSNGGKSWQEVGVLSGPNQGEPLILHFKDPQTVRYVLVKASGKCRLSLDEIEIYPAGINLQEDE